MNDTSMHLYSAKFDHARRAILCSSQRTTTVESINFSETDAVVFVIGLIA